MLGGKEWSRRSTNSPELQLMTLANATGQIQKLTTGNAQRCLKLSGILDVTRKREETVALRGIGAHSLEPLNTVADDAGNGRNGFNVVDNGGTRVQTFGSRERRLQARLATTAFEGIEKCGLLTTDVGASARMNRDVKIVIALRSAALTQDASFARLAHRGRCHGLARLHVPGGPFVRFDTYLVSGISVSPYYDALLGKLIVYAGTREEAMRKMKAALCELVVEGIETNIAEQLELVSDPRFMTGQYDLTFMEGR